MKTTILALISTCSLAQLHAATIYDESTDGPLSDVGTAPTILGSLALGDSDIIGQVGGGIRNHFTFNVAPGQALDAITLVSGTGVNHFFGIAEGVTFPTSGLLIGGLFSGTDTDDFLDTFADGGNLGSPTGVEGSSLDAGDYTILVNETLAGSFDFQLRLSTVEAVPEPSSTLLASLAIGLGLVRRRR